MEFDIKTILLLVNGLVLPCLLWIWRTANRVQEVERRIAEMPTQKSIHNIEKAMVSIEGSLRVLSVEITHLKNRQGDYEDVLGEIKAPRKGRRK